MVVGEGIGWWLLGRGWERVGYPVVAGRLVEVVEVGLLRKDRERGCSRGGVAVGKGFG